MDLYADFTTEWVDELISKNRAKQREVADDYQKNILPALTVKDPRPGTGELVEKQVNALRQMVATLAWHSQVETALASLWAYVYAKREMPATAPSPPTMPVGYEVPRPPAKAPAFYVIADQPFAPGKYAAHNDPNPLGTLITHTFPNNSVAKLIRMAIPTLFGPFNYWQEV